MVAVLPISYQSQCRESRPAIIAVCSLAKTKFIVQLVVYFPSSLAAIGHHAMMVLRRLRLSAWWSKGPFSLVAFGCPSPSAATKNWHLVSVCFLVYLIAFRFIANEVLILLPLPCMMKSKAIRMLMVNRKT
ncbi:hypothetical protein [uncultured Photobacterium sp.]|uniref:hypothetical protein n=1 Tax=uncultured Photobacterium sp. TaxID=173973 RepID=UPI0026160982|nr:hypothetical protein [uncultured Photobacterium sp.]